MASSLHFFLRLFLLLVSTSLLFTVVDAAPPAVEAQGQNQPAAIVPYPAEVPAPVAVVVGQGLVGPGVLSVSPATMSFLPSPVSSGVIGLSAAQASGLPTSKQVKSGGQRAGDVGHRAWIVPVAVAFLAATAQEIVRHA